MTNNLNTIEGAQQEVIDQLEYNLQAKGVLDAQFNPTTGLLGLINRIPDIEPSTNINLNITLTLTSAEPSVDYGGSILLSATLMASYEGASDVDLKTGEITGATITFKKGGTIIGTSITDNNGVATLLYTPVAADCDTTLNLSAVFNGTDNFNSANSNNINVDVNSTLELTSDKDILSYADNEYATLTATLNSADKNNKEVIFEVRKQSDDSLVETLTGNTDSSGIATVYYFGNGVGDLNIKAECMSFTQTYELEDCIDIDDATSDKSSKYASSITLRNNSSGSLTYNNNGYYVLSKSGSTGEIGFPIKSINGVSSNLIIEYDLYLEYKPNVTSTGGLCVYLDSNNFYSLKIDGSSHYQWTGHKISGTYNESNTVNPDIKEDEWIHCKFEITSSTFQITITTESEQTATWNQNIPSRDNTAKYTLPITWKSGSTARFKNLKIKPL